MRFESNDLLRRQAEFIYEAARLQAIAVKAPVIPATWEEREDSFKDQFLVCIARQVDEKFRGSPEELHGGWVQAYIDLGRQWGPVYDRDKKTHPDMVPYAKLGRKEKDKDAVFVALCEIAGNWIHGLEEKDGES